MPHLRELTANFPTELQLRMQLTTAFISHLTAPLAGLTLQENMFTPLPPSAASETAAFFSNLARFTKLTSLTVVLPTDDEYWSRSIHDAVMLGAPAALAPLRHLQDLSFGAEDAVLLRCMPVLAAAVPALTHLHLRVYHDTSNIVSGSWLEEGIRHLRQLPLHNLEVAIDGSPYGTQLSCSMSALRPLTAGDGATCQRLPVLQHHSRLRSHRIHE